MPDTTTIPARDAATSAAPVTYWTSADGRGSFDMSGLTAAAALRELLGQCSNDEQREGILSGSFDIASY